MHRQSPEILPKELRANLQGQLGSLDNARVHITPLKKTPWQPQYNV